MDIPAISSITTIDGSFPKSVATCDEDHIPSKTKKLNNKKWYPMEIDGKKRNKITTNKLPTVPGAIGE